MAKKVQKKKKILSFCYDIKQHVDKCRNSHKKIGYGLIGEYVLRRLNERELGMLIEAFCTGCDVQKPKGWTRNNHIDFIRGQYIW